jgi:hypothetical protein
MERLWELCHASTSSIQIVSISGYSQEVEHAQFVSSTLRETTTNQSQRRNKSLHTDQTIILLFDTKKCE